MDVALCSLTSSELTRYRFESLKGKKVSFGVAKPFVRIGDCYLKKGCVQVSSQQMSGHVEGSFMGKKRLEESNRKLEFVRTLLIDNYDSYAYNIYQDLRTINGCSIGFFSYNHAFDLSIVIRTVIIHKGEASTGAGGVIIALSKPEDGYEEMILKTCAPAKAVMKFD